MRKIRKFMSWNGFPKTLANKLIQKFTRKADQAFMSSNINNHIEDQTEQVCKVYVRLPYIGKRGTDLMHKFKLKISRILKQPCKFIVYWDTTTTGCFVSCKAKTPKEFQSSVVYKFSCPGCAKTYIGKTDRCLYTRLNEHAITDKNSEIYKHINTCEQFNYLTNLLQLNIDEPNTDQFNLTAFLLNNCNIIDRAKHWSNLLFKEALAIHRQKPELNHGTKASR